MAGNDDIAVPDACDEAVGIASRWTRGRGERVSAGLQGEPFPNSAERRVEPFLSDGFGEVVDRLRFECGERELLECSNEDDEWSAATFVATLVSGAGDIETRPFGHADIEKDDIGVCVAQCHLGLERIAAFADDVSVRVTAQELAERAAREWFVVNDECADPAVGDGHGRRPVI